MSFSKASRERLRLDLARAVQRMDVQAVHSLLAEHHGDAVDVDAVIGATPDAEQRRQALAEDYRAWAAEMADDDAADDVPAVLLALAQPALFSLLELS